VIKKKEANNEPRIVKFRSPNTFLTKTKKVGGDGNKKTTKTTKKKRHTKRNIKKVGFILSFYFSVVVVVLRIVF